MLLLFSDVSCNVEICVLSQCSHFCLESFKSSLLICKHLFWTSVWLLQGELKMCNNF